MGELLERAIRRKGLNITEIASALNVTRRTLYNWFKQKVIDKDTMERLSSIVTYEAMSNNYKTRISNINDHQVPVKDEAYWQDRYIDLLERYSSLIAETSNKQ
jgi:AcrR family transcriptional regulator